MGRIGLIELVCEPPPKHFSVARVVVVYNIPAQRSCSDKRSDLYNQSATYISYTRCAPTMMASRGDILPNAPPRSLIDLCSRKVQSSHTCDLTAPHLINSGPVTIKTHLFISRQQNLQLVFLKHNLRLIVRRNKCPDSRCSSWERRSQAPQQLTGWPKPAPKSPSSSASQSCVPAGKPLISVLLVSLLCRRCQAWRPKCDPSQHRRRRLLRPRRWLALWIYQSHWNP